MVHYLNYFCRENCVRTVIYFVKSHAKVKMCFIVGDGCDIIFILKKNQTQQESVSLVQFQENALFMMSQFHLLKFNQVTMLRFLFHGYSWVNKCYILIFVICFKNHFITGQNMTKIVIFFFTRYSSYKIFQLFKKNNILNASEVF